MGDPMRPLRWVSKSHDKLATALRAMGHKVSSSSLPKLLEELSICRHFNRKTKESGKHPDRDAQFEYINGKVEAFQAADQPVISIDAKKKELVGEFKNGAATMGRRASRSRSMPMISRTRNWVRSPLRESTTSAPTSAMSAWGSIMIPGSSPSTAFGSGSIGWGEIVIPAMTRLMITADGGGSNGSRLRLWKMALQKLADETGLLIQVCHYPPGTSKWNKDRAPHVLPHHSELARDAPGQSAGRHRTDRQHHDENRV